MTAWDSYCGTVAQGLRRHYGLNDEDVEFFDFFAKPTPRSSNWRALSRSTAWARPALSQTQPVNMPVWFRRTSSCSGTRSRREWARQRLPCLWVPSAWSSRTVSSSRELGQFRPRLTVLSAAIRTSTSASSLGRDRNGECPLPANSTTSAAMRSRAARRCQPVPMTRSCPVTR